MASYTVSQLRTAVAAIPTGANTWLIQVPDDLVLPVVTGRSVAADGTITYLVRGYFNVAARTWVPV